MGHKFTFRFTLFTSILLFSIVTAKSQDSPVDSPSLLTNELKSAQATAVDPLEKGASDFPFTLNGITVSLTTSGSVSAYSTAWNSCGVTTKVASIWIGSGSSGSITNTFSAPVNNIVYNITASNAGEVFTVTTSDGTPSISVANGCSYNVVGNTISFTSADVGAKITITSTSPFTWLQISHNGAGGGSLITLDASSLNPMVVPVNIWAILAVFFLIGSLIVIRSKRFLLKN
ncbi:hypothetical protein INQ51_13195 [Maribellus sp. CM-23]|uniref:hypothetical protein n=1 Tax=Maribellus sp. CM-23 TaxID=2781026 RepID=UPI001F2ADFD2|nr:hypothetical protein [Maribellus sp. CM-23]MCE4565266.1 hypothetical protein [Maribellus sp. CM-23]